MLHVVGVPRHSCTSQHGSKPCKPGLTVTFAVCRRNVDAANAVPLPNQLWRDRVLYMAYAEVVLFGAICIITVLQAMNFLCCGGKKKNDSKV